MKSQFRRRPLAAATAVFLVALSAPAIAENTWTGATNNDWLEPTNWSEGVAPPNGSADVRINNSANAPILAGDTITMSDSKLAVGYEAGSDARLTLTAGAKLTNSFGIIGQLAGSAGHVTVAGAGTEWKNLSPTYVGLEGNGTLDILDGGIVESTLSLIGGSGASMGTVTVSGPDSAWTSSVGILVGVEGAGSLSIERGGRVDSLEGSIGFGAGSEGIVNVSGIGSIWRNDTLKVGEGGNGVLAIMDGSRVESAIGTQVGLFGGSNGTVIVTGANSILSSEGNVEVGVEGAGSLLIEYAGTVQGFNGVIGSAAGSQGSAIVTGRGSEWENTGNVVVGRIGNGALRIEEGARVSGFNGSIGHAAGAQGRVSIDGEDSIWATQGTLQIGYEGLGELTVENGGAATANNGVVGDQANSQGTMTIRGGGSNFASAHDLHIGSRGTGSLSIADGGSANVERQVVVGHAAGAQGGIAISGQGSLMESRGLIVGSEGAGTLSVAAGGAARIVGIDAMVIGAKGTGAVAITGGGTVRNAGDAIVGHMAGAQGSVSVDGAGSTWTSDNRLTIGSLGTGTLAISNGGNVISAAGVVGEVQGSKGAVSVVGAGSVWRNQDLLNIGHQGAGELSIANGGVVESQFGGVIGGLGGSQGRVAVAGPGSAWINGDYLLVGYEGSGALVISEGGRVSNRDASVGAYVGSRGDVIVSGAGSAWSNAGELYVGMEGVGNVIVEDAGTLTSAYSHVGRYGVGSVSVIGAGSSWTSTDLFLGTEGGNGTLTLADGGVAKVAGTLGIADQNSSGALNIGAAAGESAVAAGSLQASSVELGNAAGTINFNHTGNRDRSDLVFDTPISGQGAVNQLGPGTTVLTADNTYTGITTVSAGTLAVDGSIAASTLNVQTGGRLSGTGIVGNTTLAGTLAPGHSIGELTVQGDLRQLSGSNYEVELGANGASDHVHVTGQATLESQASLRLLGDVSYVPGTRYTVLTADGGINGQYALANQGALTAFLQAKPAYDATHAYLDLAQSRSFASVGRTRNQVATATAVERIGNGHTLFDKVLLLPDEAQARDAFDQLSGEAHASVRGLLLEESRFVREASTQRLHAAPAMSASGSAPDSWGQLYGAWGRAESDGNAAQVENGQGGLLLGRDWSLEQWRLGAIGGFGRNSLQVDDRRSSADSDSWHLGVYAGTQVGAWSLRAGAAYGSNDVETRRQVKFADIDQSLRANYGVQTIQGFAEAAYSIENGLSRYEPFVDLAYVRSENEAFSEWNGSAALHGKSGTSDATVATLGLRADRQWSNAVRLRGKLGWRHMFGDDVPVSALSFAGEDSFVVAGVPFARDAAVLEAGVEWRLGRTAILGLTYDGRFGDGLQEQSLKAQLQVDF